MGYREDCVVESEKDEVLLFRRRTGVKEDRFSLFIVAASHDRLEEGSGVYVVVIPLVFFGSLFGERYEYWMLCSLEVEIIFLPWRI